MKKIKTAFFLSLIFLTVSGLHAGSGVGVTGGLNLLNDPHARATALAGSIGAGTGDISSYYYNPASLSSLNSNQFSLSYGAGLTDDAVSQAVLGHSFLKGYLGASLFFYDGGDFQFFDGVTNRTVRAQTDYLASVGYAQSVGAMDVGATLKYISSELIERETASTVAVDFGVAKNLNSRLRLSASAVNLGGKLKFQNTGDDLPQTLRVGLAFVLIPKTYKTVLYLDTPYFIQESELEGAVGLESSLGVLALRAGFKTGVDLGGFMLGAGFQWGNATLDYGFGLIDDLDSEHKVSLSYKWGQQR